MSTQREALTQSTGGAVNRNGLAAADLVLPNLVAVLHEATGAGCRYVEALRRKLQGQDNSLASQHALHGFAWIAAYAEIMRQVAEWALRLDAEGEFGEVEALLAQLLFAEYCAQLLGGIPMNQGEIIRPSDLCASDDDLHWLSTPAVRMLVSQGGTQAVKTAVAVLADRDRARACLENDGLDASLGMVRAQFHDFAREKVAPNAQDWHLRDELIPLALTDELARLGVFAITIPAEHGGLALGRIAMCVVSEELSRGWLGVGSLATRSEIAAELIMLGGSDQQKRNWLPRIASGEILPTAVFTEPDSGSDLASLRTRAVRQSGHWLVYGNKTWITHAARADLMTLLVRTDPQSTDHRGLSVLLAPKKRATHSDPFPDKGISGGEIPVIGYRGMKEYELSFDGFTVAQENLLGGVEGRGFAQLMATFESARIQTAARAIGVAQNALDLSLSYASQRWQFGRPILNFPRVSNKIAMMAAEILGARQLTYYAARQKDAGARCDLEAGMAKLVAARVAWAAADNAVQIHGGNGFAAEFPASRVLADARILNVFEGAAEIQAHVISRRLLERPTEDSHARGLD